MASGLIAPVYVRPKQTPGQEQSADPDPPAAGPSREVRYDPLAPRPTVAPTPVPPRQPLPSQEEEFQRARPDQHPAPPRRHQPVRGTGITPSPLPPTRKRPLDPPVEGAQRKRVRQGLAPWPTRQQLVETESSLSRSERQTLDREALKFGSRLRGRSLTPRS